MSVATTDRVSAADLRCILNAAQDAIVAMDADGAVSEWNDAAIHTFGHTRQEAVGAPLAELLIPERHRAAHRAGVARFRASGVTGAIGRRLELSALHKDGSEIPIAMTLSAVTVQGRLVFFAVLHDITPRRAAAALVSVSEEAVLTTAADGTVRTFNPAAERLFGRRAAEVFGRPLATLGVEDLPDDLGRPSRSAVCVNRADGTTAVAMLRVAPLGHGALLVLRDVTAQHEAEAALSHANQRFAGAFETPGEGVALVMGDGRFIAGNDALTGALGCDEGALLATDLCAVTHTDDRGAIADVLARVGEDRVRRGRARVRLLAAGGTPVPADVELAPVRDDASGDLLHLVLQVRVGAQAGTGAGCVSRHGTPDGSRNPQSMP